MKRSLIIAALLAGGSQVSAVSANDLVLTEKAYKVQSGVQLAKKVRASNDSLPVERLLNSQIEAQDTKDVQSSSLAQSNSFWLTTTHQPR